MLAVTAGAWGQCGNAALPDCADRSLVVPGRSSKGRPAGLRSPDGGGAVFVVAPRFDAEPPCLLGFASQRQPQGWMPSQWPASMTVDRSTVGRSDGLHGGLSRRGTDVLPDARVAIAGCVALGLKGWSGGF